MANGVVYSLATRTNFVFFIDLFENEHFFEVSVDREDFFYEKPRNILQPGIWIVHVDGREGSPLHLDACKAVCFVIYVSA
jgi:hypothetical protein